MSIAKKIKTVEDRQYEIWRKLTAEESIKLVSNVSMFCLRLSHLSHDNRLRKSSKTHSRNFGKT